MPLDTAGRQPLAPDTPDALTDIVRAAAADGTPLDLMGSGTRRALGRPVTANARTVSLRGLSGVREYSPTELYITVGAGTPVAEVTAALAEKGQGLLFEPPDLCALLGSTGQPTIGGAVAPGFAGPARIAGGGIRDSLIGVELVTGRAEAIRSGGKVMKNVTGYDLTKLMIGAFGIAARIGIVAVGPRHRIVRFRYPPAHFRNQRLLQADSRGHHRIGIGVFGLEMGADICRQQRRVAHHVAPVLGLQPGIVVVPANAVMDGLSRPFFGARRSGPAGHSALSSSVFRSSAVPFMQ